MRTAQELEVEYGDQLGRCEVCGLYTDEDNLHEVNKIIICEDCYTDPQ